MEPNSSSIDFSLSEDEFDELVNLYKVIAANDNAGSAEGIVASVIESSFLQILSQESGMLSMEVAKRAGI